MKAGPHDRAALPPRIPDHEVLRCIGQGSHGQVWLARSVLGVWRAVKVVRRDLFRDERPYGREFAGVQRFEPLSREDDGFVDVLHTGRNDAEGYFYYVMELADAVAAPAGPGMDVEAYEPCTLGRFMALRGRMDAEAVVDLGRRLASALGRLHEAGLLHRDIKPSNIVLVGGRPKLADIGLVVEQSEARSFVGTDGYIAPEGPNSRQADIYSLGMVLYEASTGLRRDDFPRPCDAMDGGSEAGVLRELNAVVMRACAARPEDRYADARDLGRDLALLAAGGSVRQRHRWRRWRRAMAWAAAVAGVAGVTGAAWSWQRSEWLEAGRRARLAEQELRMATLHVASATRAMHDGDNAMALVWLAQGIAEKEAAGLPVEAERVLVRQLKEHLPVIRATVMAGQGLFSVAFSPGGDRIVTSDDRGFASVWDSSTGAAVHRPIRCAQRPVQVRLCNDGIRAWAAPRIELPAFNLPTEARGHVEWFRLANGQPEGTRWDDVGWAVASPDHRWIATAGSGFGVGLGRADGGSPCRRLGAHDGPVDALAFSPDSTLLASGSYDGTVKVWRVPEGALQVQFRVEGRLSAIAWGPGTGSMATLSRDSRQQRVLQWWDTASCKERLPAVKLGPGSTFLEHGARHGHRVVTSLESHDLRLFNSGDGSVASPDLPMQGNRSVAWAMDADGGLLLTGAADGHASLWRLDDGSRVTRVPKHARAVRWVAFHPSDGSWLTAAEDGVVRLWDQGLLRDERREVPAVGQWGSGAGNGPDMDWRRAAWNVRGDTVVTVGTRPAVASSGTGRDVVLAYDTVHDRWTTIATGLVIRADSTVVAANEGDAWAISPLAPEPGGRGGNAQDVLWVTRAHGQWTHRRLPHPRQVADIRVPHVASLVTVDSTGCVRSWSQDQAAPREFFGASLSGHQAYALSPDGSRLATLDAVARRVRVAPWQALEGPRADFVTDGPVSGLRFLGRSNVLGTTHAMTTAMAWDVERGKPLPLSESGLGRVKDADWNDLHQWFLTCPESGPASILESATGERRMLGGDLLARSRLRASFSGDGRWVVTVDTLNHVRVFDAATGIQVTPALGHPGRVWWAGVSQDRSLVTFSLPNVLRRWTLTPDPSPAPTLAREASVLSGRDVDDRGRERWMEIVPPGEPRPEKNPPKSKDHL